MPSRSKFFGLRNTPFSLATILTAGLIPLCAAASTERIFTIDDASSSGEYFTSPTISPSISVNSNNSTNPQWTHENCGNCLDKPNLTAVNGGTYTAIYLPPGNTLQYNISFEFNGDSIYVYFILSNQATTSCKFSLDGNASLYTGSTVDAYQYNTLAFSSEGLPSYTHRLAITTEGEPNMPNYLNFDFAQFTRPSPTIFVASSTNGTDHDPPPPSSSSPPNNHTTMKAILGGVVGGFLAVVALIAVAAFYRSRRLRELKLQARAHPSNGAYRGFNELRNNASHPTPNERRHLIPFPAPTSFDDHNYERGDSSSNALITPFDPNHFSHHHHHHPSMTLEHRDQRRVERQHELNHRLESITTQMRSLKASYVQDQIRLQHAQQQQQQQPRTREQDIHPEQNEHTNPSNSDPPIIQFVAGGQPRPVKSITAGGVGETHISNWPDTDHPSALLPGGRMPEPLAYGVEDRGLGEPMVNPQVLADMQGQMRIMMDQIQYLRTQQNSPYVQGLTDEPPPGYTEAISLYHRSPR